MRLTKIEMAKVVVQALYNMTSAPSDDHPAVVKRARNGTVKILTEQYTLARAILDTKSN